MWVARRALYVRPMIRGKHLHERNPQYIIVRKIVKLSKVALTILSSVLATLRFYLSGTVNIKFSGSVESCSLVATVCECVHSLDVLHLLVQSSSRILELKEKKNRSNSPFRFSLPFPVHLITHQLSSFLHPKTFPGEHSLFGIKFQ